MYCLGDSSSNIALAAALVALLAACAGDSATGPAEQPPERTGTTLDILRAEGGGVRAAGVHDPWAGVAANYDIGGLERMVRALPLRRSPGERVQLVVDQGHDSVERVRIAGPPALEQPGHVAGRWRGHHVLRCAEVPGVMRPG